MKAEDIVKQLVTKLPTLTDSFTSSLAIDSITAGGTTTATATVAAGHGLSDGQVVTITGTYAPITISSITRAGTVMTVVTATAHDFSYSTNEKADGLVQDVIISGATEAQFNGTFQLASVPNRYTLTITVADTGSTTATGSPVLENGSNAYAQYNGTYNATVVDSTHFTYPLAAAIANDAIGTPIMKFNHRVSAAASIDRAIEAYTKQAEGVWWCFVILGDTTASKSLQNRSDSTGRAVSGAQYHQELTETFGVYLLVPATSSIGARLQRDEAEDLVPLVFQSVLWAQFPVSYPNAQQFRTTFTGHGFYQYNTAVYIHEITFEQNVDIDFENTVGNSPDVAFRDLDMTLLNSLGTGTQSASINLDETP